MNKESYKITIHSFNRISFAEIENGDVQTFLVRFSLLGENIMGVGMMRVPNVQDDDQMVEIVDLSGAFSGKTEGILICADIAEIDMPIGLRRSIAKYSALDAVGTVESCLAEELDSCNPEGHAYRTATIVRNYIDTEGLDHLIQDLREIEADNDGWASESIAELTTLIERIPAELLDEEANDES